MPQLLPKICLIEDDEIMGESLADRLELEGFSFDWHRDGCAAHAALRSHDYALVISDIRLPDITGDALYEQLRGEHLSLPPFVFITGHADIDTAVRLLKAGAHDYITKPFDLDELIEKINAVVAQGSSQGHTALGQSPAMRRIEAMLHRLATSDTSVLITGESGVGKERVAQALHQLTGVTKPFIAVNCGALTESLLEAELFGYEKGAFTGALRTKKGVFEQANGGTLFLDEIGDMPLSMQVKLLRALQERCIVRVGGETPIPVDLRLMCATHQVLQERVQSGDFREDLYYRINVVELRIPPLRERPEDILPLARQFLAAIAATNKKPPLILTPAAEHALKHYRWPGNVRELKNALERASLMSDGRTIAHDKLFDRPAPQLTEQQVEAGSLRDYLSECERDFIVHALDNCQWQIACCADSLGISRKNLWEKMRKLGIDKDTVGSKP
ncbi:sigma-54-dependent transcriptional regulator [Rhodoferax sp.]|uniref:sigma-54-dependent transcriptional regulator n=2 Tax=Rhodoferax sp. TaxID=50421 RepID=UPI002718E2E1|nr:sigma-54 dependent transcriptional regulator [Rhodoferax sp.]MDO9144403.1 sigma-54 dependent transcriptional regulator [Rhodoferax sp.]MDP1531583.1 sigma-54 dependent transcriptional regulator [Rhodoferax sp.]MDP1944140.1 sigma-54 dependent transcriptional regulator [Rhodoferax sp.]MDP2441206.1 sigma-54 dependent transcriptional regulator [Rhodoferax sp.]MDP3192860.1 sigma-54 dependent transcriptional regulator [Rhodoferax sp.]